MHNITQKENHPDAEISWAGNANVILIKGDKRKMIHYWKESEKKGLSPAGTVDETYLRNFFSQIFTELNDINPALSKILFEALEKSLKRKRD